MITLSNFLRRVELNANGASNKPHSGDFHLLRNRIVHEERWATILKKLHIVSHQEVLQGRLNFSWRQFLCLPLFYQILWSMYYSLMPRLLDKNSMSFFVPASICFSSQPRWPLLMFNRGMHLRYNSMCSY